MLTIIIKSIFKLQKYSYFMSDSTMMRVHISFKNRIDKYLEDFEKQIGIKITAVQATRKLEEKIKLQGGLVIP